MRRHPDYRPAEGGAALITGLVMLLVITLLSVSAMRSSRLELRMAGNHEARLGAQQAAQALIDAIFATPSTVPVVGTVGYKACTPHEAGCDTNDIHLDGGVFPDELANADLGAVAERLGPEEVPIPRGLETSADKFTGAAFRLRATFDRSDESLGRSEIVEGMLVLVPKN